MCIFGPDATQREKEQSKQQKIRNPWLSPLAGGTTLSAGRVTCIFLNKINTKIRAGKIAPWVKHFPPKCKDLDLDPQDHIEPGMVVHSHTQEQDGSRRQESHQEIMGQLAWHTLPQARRKSGTKN